MNGRSAQRLVVSIAVAALCASVATAISPRATRADTPPPPSWTFDLSPDNVVPGPGDPSIDPSQGSMFPSDEPGVLCPNFDVPEGAVSAGLYHAPAGSTGDLVVDLSAYIGEYQ